MSALSIVIVPHVALGGKAKNVANIDHRIVNHGSRYGRNHVQSSRIGTGRKSNR